jgi:hypothetical protein
MLPALYSAGRTITWRAGVTELIELISDEVLKIAWQTKAASPIRRTCRI